MIDGTVGVVNAAEGKPVSLLTFTIINAKIVAIDLLDDSVRLDEADLAILEAPAPY